MLSVVVVVLVGQREERFGFLVRWICRRRRCCSRRIVPHGKDQQHDERESQRLGVADEYSQLVREEAQAILNRISRGMRIPSRPTARHDPLTVDGVPQADQLHARHADSHSPAHTLDGDFLGVAREFAVLNLAVVVVVARVDLHNFLLPQVFHDILRDQWCQHSLVLVSGL